MVGPVTPTGDGREFLAVAVAAGLAMVSGLVIAAGMIVTLPTRVLVAALSIFASAALIAAWLAYRQARARDRSVLGALGHAFKAAGRWLWHFMP